MADAAPMADAVAEEAKPAAEAPGAEAQAAAADEAAAEEEGDATPEERKVELPVLSAALTSAVSMVVEEDAQATEAAGEASAGPERSALILRMFSFLDALFRGVPETQFSLRDALDQLGGKLDTDLRAAGLKPLVKLALKHYVQKRGDDAAVELPAGRGPSGLSATRCRELGRYTMTSRPP